MATKKIVLITGSTNGIGYEAVKALYNSPNGPYHILMGHRNLPKAKSAISRIQSTSPTTSINTLEPIEVDLTSDTTIASCATYITTHYTRLDTLVNNAGVNMDLTYLTGTLTPREQFQQTFNINVSGTHALTYSLAPLLLQSSDPRLIFVSGLASLTLQAERYFPTPDLPAGWPKRVEFETVAYKCSKVALSMLMLDWKHKLKADGVRVWGLGPGMCATNLGGVSEEVGRRLGAGPASVGGEHVRDVVEGVRDGEEGKIVGTNGGIVAW